MKETLNTEYPLKKEYQEYTLGLALFDAVPVIVFLMSGIVIYSMFGSPVFLTGVILSFLGGMSKVIWKILIVTRKRDIAVLAKAFRPLMIGGFVMMLLSVLLTAGQGSLKGLWNGLTMMPATIFFIAGIACMGYMGYLGSHMDSSARSNWIEEAVNSIAQIFILAGLIIVYFGSYYHATEAALEALATDSDQTANAVTVEASANGYYFDGAGEETMLIFYPGAKVEASAYAPLMRALAENGTDCYLCKMPLNFALLGKDMAEEIRDDLEDSTTDYQKWYLAGHSLGGVAASMLAVEEDDAWDGIVFLASYPTDELDIPALSIYGTEDKVLNLESYEEAGAKGCWPDDFTEEKISGGNHAQFGSYGLQKGDGEASITEQQQQAKTAQKISEWISR